MKKLILLFLLFPMFIFAKTGSGPKVYYNSPTPTASINPVLLLTTPTPSPTITNNEINSQESLKNML